MPYCPWQRASGILVNMKEKALKSVLLSMLCLLMSGCIDSFYYSDIGQKYFFDSYHPIMNQKECSQELCLIRYIFVNSELKSRYCENYPDSENKTIVVCPAEYKNKIADLNAAMAGCLADAEKRTTNQFHHTTREYCWDKMQ